MNKKSEAIKKMFHPASIAIIGASQSAGKQGNSVIRYLKRYGYQGRVYPVNPKADQIEGFPCYPSVTAIPDEVDLAVISLPNRLVPQAARDCIAKGIHAAVVWSAGFGELKSETGKQLDAELRQICEEGELYICGPNSLGVINAHEAAVASFWIISLKESRSTSTSTPISLPSSVNCLFSTSYCASAVRQVQMISFSPAYSPSAEAATVNTEASIRTASVIARIFFISVFLSFFYFCIFTAENPPLNTSAGSEDPSVFLQPFLKCPDIDIPRRHAFVYGELGRDAGRFSPTRSPQSGGRITFAVRPNTSLAAGERHFTATR